MPANVDGMVREGISAYRAGRKDEARALLLRAVEIDQYNEEAWLWLSAVVESVDEQRTCLENVLTINPNNARAKQGLQMLSQKSAPAAPARSTAAHDDDILASTSFTGAPTPSSDPFGLDDDDELPASLGIDVAAAPPARTSAAPTASSSASSNYQVDEPSSEEYDAWMSNLNLGGNSAQDVFQAGAIDAAQQFMSTNFDDTEVEADDDLFDMGSGSSVFDTDDDDDLFSSGPFGTDTAPPVSNTPPPKSKSPAAAFSSKSTSLTSRKSPDSLLDEIEDDDVLSTDFDQDFNQNSLDDLEAAEFFQYIPRDIKPTRLPGTRERYPALVILGLLGVIVLNIGAVALMVMNLTAQ